MFWKDLDEAEQKSFVAQLESIDFELFATLQKQFLHQTHDATSSTITPYPYISLEDSVATEQLRDRGKEIIRNGDIGVLTVAGGQGTRLGWRGPKGTFPATPVTGKSLFQVIAEQILFANRAYNVTIPWYIMSSNENDDVTRSFMQDNNCFGLRRADIFIFTQGVVPAMDEQGNMLLADRNKLVVNPDGHGGVISALKQSGGLEEMIGRGIKHLSYVQVDNPLAKVIDPVFIALHTTDKDSSAEISSKCVEKTNPEEPVGVFCTVDGKAAIVEYSDLPHEKKVQVDPDGALTFRAGSIAIHLLCTTFIDEIADDLPWHIAQKKISHLSIDDGHRVDPETPNAYKCERFVFDVLRMARKPLVLQTSREEEFAPIKNATGEDSPATSHALQQKRAARWLQAKGLKVPDSAVVEISPLSCSSPDELDEALLPDSIHDEEIVVL